MLCRALEEAVVVFAGAPLSLEDLLEFDVLLAPLCLLVILAGLNVTLGTIASTNHATLDAFAFRVFASALISLLIWLVSSGDHHLIVGADVYIILSLQLFLILQLLLLQLLL